MRHRFSGKLTLPFLVLFAVMLIGAPVKGWAQEVDPQVTEALNEWRAEAAKEDLRTAEQEVQNPTDIAETTQPDKRKEAADAQCDSATDNCDEQKQTADKHEQKTKQKVDQDTNKTGKGYGKCWLGPTACGGLSAVSEMGVRLLANAVDFKKASSEDNGASCNLKTAPMLAKPIGTAYLATPIKAGGGGSQCGNICPQNGLIPCQSSDYCNKDKEKKYQSPNKREQGQNSTKCQSVDESGQYHSNCN